MTRALDRDTLEQLFKEIDGELSEPWEFIWWLSAVLL